MGFSHPNHEPFPKGTILSCLSLDCYVSAIVMLTVLLITSSFQLPVVFIVLNNSGIYNGLDEESWKSVISEDNLGFRYSLLCI